MESLSPEESQFILEAARFLENPSLLIRVANQLGAPFEALQKRLPERANRAVQTATQASLTRALELAIRTLEPGPASADWALAQDRATSSGKLGITAAALSGALGGALGLPGLAIDLPVTTGILVRTIAKTAQDFGADLEDPRVRLECLYVFTLGTRSPSDDAAEVSYFASRIGFAKLIQDAAAFLATRSAAEALKALRGGTAPILVRFLGALASRFNLVVSQKFVAGAVPLVGAAGGAAINAAFGKHFADAAKYHFGLKRLESRHGEALVRSIYENSKS